MKNLLFILGMTAVLSVLSVRAFEPIYLPNYLNSSSLTIDCQTQPGFCFRISSSSRPNGSSKGNITIHNVSSSGLSLEEVKEIFGVNVSGLGIIATRGTLKFNYAATVINDKNQAVPLKGSASVFIWGGAEKDESNHFQVKLVRDRDGEMFNITEDYETFISMTLGKIYQSIYAELLENYINKSLKLTPNVRPTHHVKVQVRDLLKNL